MTPREIRRLPEARVLEHWLELYRAGKHAKVIGEGQKPPTFQYVGKDPMWVEVEIPHEMYRSEWNDDEPALSSAQIDRAVGYATRPGSLPPGIALFTGRRGNKRAYVSDGNHRAHAAYLRGLPAARFYMPAGDWTKFLAANRAAV